MTTLAPIAIFIYARPDHLRRTIEELQQCEGFYQSPIFVFADGPKRPEQMPQIEAARNVAKQMLGERAVYRFAETNKGLANSILDGVTELTKSHGKVIVIEDDLSLAPQFLKFINTALDQYETAANVYQVSGHMFDVPELRNSNSAVMLPLTTSWGWGTWQRAWEQFDPACTGWQDLATDRGMRHRFSVHGAYDYASMLERQMRGKADSWAVRWYYSVFKQSGLTVFPPTTLVSNRGMDGSGSHGRGLFRKFQSPLSFSNKRASMPVPKIDQRAYEAVRKAIFHQNGGFIGRIIDRLKQFIR